MGPQVLYGRCVQLIAIESLDALFLKENIPIDVGPIYQRARKDLSPAAQRCIRDSMRAHAGHKSWIVGAQPEFQNPQWPVMPAPEESGIHRGVVVPSTALVASVRVMVRHIRVGARTFALCSRVFRSPLPNVWTSGVAAWKRAEIVCGKKKLQFRQLYRAWWYAVGGRVRQRTLRTLPINRTPVISTGLHFGCCVGAGVS